MKTLVAALMMGAVVAMATISGAQMTTYYGVQSNPEVGSTSITNMNTGQTYIFSQPQPQPRQQVPPLNTQYPDLGKSMQDAQRIRQLRGW